jgi:hypothetical protein
MLASDGTQRVNPATPSKALLHVANGRPRSPVGGVPFLTSRERSSREVRLDRRVEEREPLAEVGLDRELRLELGLQLQLSCVVAFLLRAGGDERPPRSRLEAVDPVDRVLAAVEAERRGEELAAEAARLQL